jgi:HlyD family secretion protein
MSPKRIVPIVLVLAAGGWAAWHFLVTPSRRDRNLTASGTVEATDAQLGFKVPGRILAIGPHEGDRVAAGAEIARLDTSEIDARRSQAEAAVGIARAQLDELEAGTRREELAQARAQLAAARDRVADSQRDLERAQTLFAGKAVSREQLDKAQLGLDLAIAARDQTAEQVRLLVAGPRPEKIAAARAQLASAEAGLATIGASLADYTLHAPFAGVVSVRDREPGEIVAAGAPILTLLDTSDRWVRIYVPENRLGGVHLGDRARITSDSFPDKSYPGTVAYIADEAEFTPKNVQTREERVRLVYAVKVRIEDDAGQELKPGLPADVELLPAGTS